MGQVAGISLESVIPFFGRGAVGGAALAKHAGGFLQALGAGPRGAERFADVASFLGQGDEEALGGHEGVTRRLCAIFGGAEHTRHFWLHEKLPAAALHLRNLGKQGFDRLVGFVGPPAGALYKRPRQAILFLKQHL